MAVAKVDAQFHSPEDDQIAAIRSIEKRREIGNSAALSAFVKREVLPGAQSADEMRDFAKNAAGTYFHESCTRKTGQDDMPVVDANLKG